MSKHEFGHYYIARLDKMLGPKAINRFGQVVGATSFDPSGRAVLWQPDAKRGSKGQLCLLDDLHGPASYAIGINDQGEIIGYALDVSAPPIPRVVLWSPSTHNALPSKPPESLNFAPLLGPNFAPSSLTGSINDSGFVATNAGSSPHAALHGPKGSYVEFDNLGFYYVAAINQQGWFTGSRTDAGILHPYCYRPKSMLDSPDAPLPPYDLTSGASYFLGSGAGFGQQGNGLSISDFDPKKGVAIAANANDNNHSEPLLWTLPQNDFVRINPALAIAFPGPPTTDSAYAYGINNKWQVVGWNISRSGAYLFDHASGQAVELKTLLDKKSQENWGLTKALDINDFGQIIGVGWYEQQAAAFLMTPER